MYRFIVCLFILICNKAEAQQASALSLADSLYAVGDYSEAINAYQKLDHQNGAIPLKIARAYRAKGSYDRALNFFAKAAKENGAMIAKNEYGTLLITTGKFKKADSIYSILIDKHDKNPNFYYQRGRARLKNAPPPPPRRQSCR